MFKFKIVVCFLSILLSVYAFPDGAPSDTCVKKRANQPNHGEARPQNPHSNPFEMMASSDIYHPGQELSVVIYPHSQHDTFRGFFIQARDSSTNEWIGIFEKSENTKILPECSAITHSDNRDKLVAKLTWKAPQHKHGRVYFTGTVLKEYGTFWSDIIGKIPSQPYQHGTVLKEYGTFWSDIIGKIPSQPYQQ